MAFGTIVVELTRHMIRVRRRIEIGRMTIPACMREILVLVIHMATVTGNRLMCASQRKLGAAMIERRWRPHRRCVTWTAVVTEIAEHMIGIRWLCELSLMTLVAIGKV